MPTLPSYDPNSGVCDSPHVVILGAGASCAALPKGDKQGRKLPVLASTASAIGIADVLEEKGFVDTSDFEALYDRLVESGKDPALLSLIEQTVWEYFHNLELPSKANIYDFLLLALREHDLVASFNWDPLLLQAYQRNAKVYRLKLPRIVFLHGNVGMGFCEHDRIKGYLKNSCSICGRPFTPSKLLFPVRKKDYSADPLIRNEWDELRSQLERAYMLTIFGYSAPSTDVEARDLLLNTWRKNPHFELAEINLIDIKPRGLLVSTWKEFFCRSHYGVCKTIFNSWLFRYPRRSCEALAMSTLENKPWTENPFPRFRTLSNLQEWVAPLLLEEDKGHFSGSPCPRHTA